MINFLGAGGGGGGSCAVVAFSGGGDALLPEICGGAPSAPVGLAESSTPLRLAAPCRDLLGLVDLAAWLALGGGGLSAGELAGGAAVAGGVIAVTAPGSLTL